MENVCSKCGVAKPEGDFSLGRRACKACEKARSAKWNAENPEKVKASRAKWHAENREKVKARKAKYRAENAEKEKAYRAKHRVENAEKAKAYVAKYRVENAEKVKAYVAKQTAELSPSYVANLLRIPVAEIPPELLDLKREQLQLYRLTNKLRKEIRNE